VSILFHAAVLVGPIGLAGSPPTFSSSARADEVGEVLQSLQADHRVRDARPIAPLGSEVRLKRPGPLGCIESSSQIVFARTLSNKSRDSTRYHEISGETFTRMHPPVR